MKDRQPSTAPSEPSKVTKPKRTIRVALAIVATIIGGLWVGYLFGRNPRTDLFERKPVEALLRDLARSDTDFDRMKQRAWQALPEMFQTGFSEAAPIPARRVRTLAAMELKRRAPKAVEAVPGLADALDHSEDGVRKSALQTLAIYGKAGRPALPAVLRVFDAGVTNTVLRTEAARTLVAIAPDSAEVRARLVAAMRGNSRRSQTEGNANPDSADAQALKDTFTRLLGRLINPDDEVVAILLDELMRADGTSGIETIDALERIGAGKPQVIPGLVQRLRMMTIFPAAPAADRANPATLPPPRVRSFTPSTVAAGRSAPSSEALLWALLGVLQHLARPDNEVVPLLLETLKTADTFVAGGIIKVLGNLGPITPEVLPALIPLIHHGDPTIRRAAVNAIGMMQTVGEPAVPALVEALRKALQERDLPPRETVAQDPRFPQRARLRGAVQNQRRGPTQWQSWPMPSSSPTATLVRTLGQIGPGAQAAIPLLTNLIANPANKAGMGLDILRYETGLALWQMDRHNRVARQVLIESLNIPAPELAPEFLTRLMFHFPAMDEGDLPILLEAADHIDEIVRIDAIQALEKLGARAVKAVPVLRRIANDQLDPLRGPARHALERIQSVIEE